MVSWRRHACEHASSRNNHKNKSAEKRWLVKSVAVIIMALDSDTKKETAKMQPKKLVDDAEKDEA